MFVYPVASTLIPGKVADIAASSDKTTGAIDQITGDFRASIQINSHAIARQIASGSDALVPGAKQMLAADFASGRLVPVHFRVPEMRTQYAILTLRGRTLSPVAQAFIAILREVESELAMPEALHESRNAASLKRGKKQPSRLRSLA